MTTKPSTDELLDQAFQRIAELETISYENSKGIAAIAGGGFWRRSPRAHRHAAQVDQAREAARLADVAA